MYNTYSAKYFSFHETTLLRCNNQGFSIIQSGNMLLCFTCAKNCGVWCLRFWSVIIWGEMLWGFGGLVC